MVRSWIAAAALGSVLVSASDEAVKLNNGVLMPTMAFAANVWDAETCRDATSKALDAGFRFVWSSALVGASCQIAQGESIRASGLERSQVFLSGTVNSASCSDFQDCYRQTKDGAEEQFTTLGFDPLDMLMLDFPSQSGCTGIRGQWRAFEELYASGRARTIAVSNFSPDFIECIASRGDAVVPSVNQLHYAIGRRGTMIQDNAKYGVVVQSYSPLNDGALLSDQTCKAIGKNHGKSAAQIALKWILQTSGTIATQSTQLAHLREDLDIFDFTLTDDEVARLSQEEVVLI